MRILIMEDDAGAAEAMAKGLAEAGHESALAPDGEAGLHQARGPPGRGGGGGGGARVGCVATAE